MFNINKIKKVIDIMSLKKKVSIDFLMPEYMLMVDFAKKSNHSNSTVINALVNTFIPISTTIRSELSVFCWNKFTQTLNKLQEASGFEAQEISVEARQWKVLAKYFDEEENDLSSKGMRKIMLKEGYCIFPSDWIVLGNIFGAPEECMYAGVVESRNHSIYGIPHFLFFCDKKYAREYDDELEDKVYAECEKVFPEFKKFYNMQIHLTKEEEKDIEKMTEWSKAPCFGLFHLVEKGDPLYWNALRPDYIPPAGAMIVR